MATSSGFSIAPQPMNEQTDDAERLRARMNEDAREPDEADNANLPPIDLARDALLFDVDGTLLNIATVPEAVSVPSSLKNSLAQLIEKTDGATALVSGRLIAVLDSLFAPLKLAAIGCHGAEMRTSPSGPIERRAAPLPERVKQAFADVAVAEPRIRVEDKIYTLAFHYRAAPDREESLLTLLRARIEPFAPEFVLLHGKAIIEVKAANIDKGEALRALLHRPPFAHRRPIYFGDDTTDLDAFSVLPDFSGLGVSVGRVLPHTQATVHSPEDVRQWLARLAGN
jgi:trehalose 6-phosphate phosphatase